MIYDERQLTRWSHALRLGSPEAGRRLACHRWSGTRTGAPASGEDEEDKAKTLAILLVVAALFSRAV